MAPVTYLPTSGGTEPDSRVYATAPAKCGSTIGWDYTGQGGIRILYAAFTSGMLVFVSRLAQAHCLTNPSLSCVALIVPLDRIDWRSCIFAQKKSGNPEALHAHTSLHCKPQFTLKR